MANEQHHQPNIDIARELLSPYLDGEITAEERVLVEASLAVSGQLRHDLETLRQTVSLLSDLPPVPAPRPFTLSVADVSTQPAAAAPRRILGLPVWLAGWAMTAAGLLCVLAIGGVLFTRQFQGGATSALIAQSEAPAQPQAAAPQSESYGAAEAPTAEVKPELAPAEPPAPAPEEELIPPEPPAEQKAESTESAARQEANEVEETQEPAAVDQAEQMAAPAGESGNDEVGQAGPEGSTAESAAPLAQESLAGAAAAPTPSAAPTMAALAAPSATQAMAENPAPVEAPAEEAPAAQTERAGAPSAAAPPAEQKLAPSEQTTPEPLPSIERQSTTAISPLPTPTMTAPATATPMPAPTLPPSPTVSSVPLTPTAAASQVGSNRPMTLVIIIAGLVVSAGLLLIGLIIWFRQKQQN